MTYKYGEMFERLGVTGMGRRGADWCGLTPEGVLVIMSHQNFYKRLEAGEWVYLHPGDARTPNTSGQAKRSVRRIADYFEPGKQVLLPVGVFSSDGGWASDGTHIPSKFSHATGDVYRAKMSEFDAATCRFVCRDLEKFTV